MRSTRTEAAYVSATISTEVLAVVGSAIAFLALALALKADLRTCNRAKPNFRDEPVFGEFDCLLPGEVDWWDSMCIWTPLDSLNASHEVSGSLKVKYRRKRHWFRSGCVSA